MHLWHENDCMQISIYIAFHFRWKNLMKCRANACSCAGFIQYVEIKARHRIFFFILPLFCLGLSCVLIGKWSWTLFCRCCLYLCSIAWCTLFKYVQLIFYCYWWFLEIRQINTHENGYDIFPTINIFTDTFSL